MAGGGPITGFLATRAAAAAAPLAGHRVAAVAVEGGGGGGGGIADVPVSRGRKATLGGMRSRSRSRAKRLLGSPAGVPGVVPELFTRILKVQRS